MKALLGACAAVMMVSACNQGSQQRQPTHADKGTNVAEREAPPIPPPGTGPDAKTPLGRPAAAIDPKSPEAAANAIQDYADLLEHHRLAEAAELWSDKLTAKRFADELNPEVHVHIGKPRAIEGAAGSMYATIPVVFYGDTYSKPATVQLRRVNNVPGSTDAQRRWHIERIDWAAAN